MSEQVATTEVDPNAPPPPDLTLPEKDQVLPPPEKKGKDEEEQIPVRATPPSRGRFGLQEEYNQTWRLNVAIGVTPDQCMDEGFWTHLAIHLRPGDEIRVFPDNMTWELVLHVVDKGKAFAHVVKKAFYELAPTSGESNLPSTYKVEWAGTTKKFRFLREGKEVRDGFATKEIAIRAASNHEAAVNR